MNKLSEDALDFFRKHGAAGGKKAASQLTAEERKAKAKHAVDARETQRKKVKAKKKGVR